jgi:ABC-type branched-subunit amino acid transport system permease subunit
LITVGVGFVLGLPSLRLHGDYLAIVTLGFGQIFVQLTTAMNRVFVPWSTQAINLTGGPNGIPGLDRLTILGVRAETETAYYYILLATLGLVLLFVYRLNHSRLGRAWRSIREDALASEAMGIPTDRLRLLAFSTGAGIAGFAGAIFAAWQQSVFPQNFDVALLITLYAMVVLGGVGSLPGMIAGSLVITALPELLRPGTTLGGIEISHILFYAGVLAFLAIFLRSRWRFTLIIGGVIVLGFAVRLLVSSITPEAVTLPTTGSALSKLMQGWLVIPQNAINATGLGNLAFFVVVGLLVALTRLPRNVRNALLVVVLYLLAFVWETRLSKEPSTARLLLTGVLLVMLMNYRPQGLFGQRRVEIG